MTSSELTVRQSIAETLRGGPVTAKDISRAVGIKEKEVIEHLQHIARSVASGRDGTRFVVHPSACLSCGFVFRKRDRLKTPSRCPLCASEEITEMRFGITGG
ncbi:MAG: transcriptional regulator [Thermodesulfobacteriota bacterium]